MYIQVILNLNQEEKLLGNKFIDNLKNLNSVRAVARSENPRGHVLLGGDNVPPLVEIGLTDLPKTVGARAPPAPPLATGLPCIAVQSTEEMV